MFDWRAGWVESRGEMVNAFTDSTGAFTGLPSQGDVMRIMMRQEAISSTARFPRRDFRLLIVLNRHVGFGLRLASLFSPNLHARVATGERLTAHRHA